jgi:glycosyltransferase involved in cell wall biosynthesis
LQVSILIPAFRPTFLAQAIASVLTQGWSDYELLIHDDSGARDVEAVVRRFDDPRIRYSRTAGREGSAANIRQLWDRAQGDFIKYLFDDDLMLPNAVREFVDVFALNPKAAGAFGHRDVIDGEGRVTQEPRVMAPNRCAPLSRPQLAKMMLTDSKNRVGEFSNMMMNRAAGASLDDMFVYEGFEIEMLVDVAFALNAAGKGGFVGFARTVGQFRRHPEQNSEIDFNPAYAKVRCEWELLLRGEYAAGRLEPADALAGAAHLQGVYAAYEARLPELAVLKPGLERLKAQVELGDRDVLGEDFRRSWDALGAAMRRRT